MKTRDTMTQQLLGFHYFVLDCFLIFKQMLKSSCKLYNIYLGNFPVDMGKLNVDVFSVQIAVDRVYRILTFRIIVKYTF